MLTYYVLSSFSALSHPFPHSTAMVLLTFKSVLVFRELNMDLSLCWTKLPHDIVCHVIDQTDDVTTLDSWCAATRYNRSPHSPQYCPPEPLVGSLAQPG